MKQDNTNTENLAQGLALCIELYQCVPNEDPDEPSSAYLWPLRELEAAVRCVARSKAGNSEARSHLQHVRELLRVTAENIRDLGFRMLAGEIEGLAQEPKGRAAGSKAIEEGTTHGQIE